MKLPRGVALGYYMAGLQPEINKINRMFNKLTQVEI